MNLYLESSAVLRDLLAGVLERLVVLSTDVRVRSNAQALGFMVAPG